MNANIDSLNPPSVEIRIPMSPNDKFFRMLHYLLLSIKEFGGDILAKAAVVVSLSRDEPIGNLNERYPWISDFPVTFRAVDQSLFDKYEYDGTGLDRFFVPSTADLVIMCDADILITNNLDSALLRAYREQVHLGFIAHVSPFNQKSYSHLSSHEWWQRIFQEAGLQMPRLDQRHTAWNFMGVVRSPEHYFCPYYYNYGFIISPRHHIEAMATTFEKDMLHVDRVLDSWFKSQIANSLSYTRHNLKCGNLSINYNYPLHVPEEEIRKLNPDPDGENRPEDVRVFHYLGQGTFNPKDFESEEQLSQALLRRNLTPTKAHFRDRLLYLHDKIGTADAFARRAKKLNRDHSINRTILIGGPRRSGTTLLAAILATDPKANPLGQEAQFLTKQLQAYKWSMAHFDAFGKSFFSSASAFSEFSRQQFSRFIREMAQFASPKGILILKNPELSMLVKEMDHLMPEAMILATIRDPRDQIASEMEVGSRRVSDGILDRNYLERKIMTYCQHYNNYVHCLIQFKRQCPDRIKFIRYEDLVLDSEKTLNHIAHVTQLDLAFNHKSPWQRVSEDAGLDQSPSRSELYGMPINPRSVGRYQQDLAPFEIEQVEEACRAAMLLFNYS